MKESFTRIQQKSPVDTSDFVKDRNQIIAKAKPLGIYVAERSTLPVEYDFLEKASPHELSIIDDRNNLMASQTGPP